MLEVEQGSSWLPARTVKDEILEQGTWRRDMAAAVTAAGRELNLRKQRSKSFYIYLLLWRMGATV